MNVEGGQLTDSRTRPALGPKGKGTESSQGNTQSVALPSGLSEILVTAIGNSHATPQQNLDGRKYNNMHHKLHLVLRDLLKKNGQSARKAAKACGVPLSTFNGYLKPDRHQIDPNHLLAMASYFGVSLDYLLGSKEPNKHIEGLPTKKIFSRWVKLTIEEIADDDDVGDLIKGGKK